MCVFFVDLCFTGRSSFYSFRKDSFRKDRRELCNVFRLHVYRDRVGGEGEFLENTVVRISLPKGLPLGFGEICVDF